MAVRGAEEGEVAGEGAGASLPDEVTAEVSPRPVNTHIAAVLNLPKKQELQKLLDISGDCDSD